MDAKMCKFYQGLKLNLKQSDVWTADPRQLGLSSDAYKTMQNARLYLQTYAPDVAGFFHAGSRQWESQQGYSGVPVKSVSYAKNGTALKTTQLTKVDQVDVSEAEFYTVPAGYKAI